MRHELNVIFSKDVDLLILIAIVRGSMGHREPERLADHIVERHCQEVASKSQQDHSVYSVELSPLGFLLKDIVYFHSLNSFFHSQRE